MESGRQGLGRHRVVMVIVGQGLAGTLVALEAERRGLDFVVVDEGSGDQASRVAAGLFNPLIGPRFTPDTEGWDRLVPFYRHWEQVLGVSILHPVDLLRPWSETMAAPSVPRSAPGWTAEVTTEGVWIRGGGWVDLPALLDAARARWLRSGRLEERGFSPEEGRGKTVIWCGGLVSFTSAPWVGTPGVAEAWQGVRGDVLTVRIPGLSWAHGEIGPQFLLPLGQSLFRWGATHESDVTDMGFRAEALAVLQKGLRTRLPDHEVEIVAHRWGVRPASRLKTPLVVRHREEPGWTLFNGFGGRGVALIPRWIDALALE